MGPSCSGMSGMVIVVGGGLARLCNTMQSVVTVFENKTATAIKTTTPE